MNAQKTNGHVRKRKADRLVREVMQYVNDNLEKDLHEKTVAAFFKISTSTLRYAFNLQGIPYHQFVEQQRMIEARRLIDKERLLIKEAMYQTGYKNRSAFNKAFKKHFGKNPSDFQ